MSLSSQQHADLADDAYNNRKIGVRKPDAEELEVINGTTYRILEHYRNPRNGYAGTVYQRTDTGDIEVAHRGTEVKNIPGLVMDLAYTDGNMVLRKVSPQADDAIALTQRALEKAEDIGARSGHTPQVTVTGHSLGGALAQVTAHHFDLRGETFNAYGAASLGLRVPEGGDKVLNHVMAADLVSSAAPHYGQVRVYATQQEIKTLGNAIVGYDNDRQDLGDLRMRGVAPLLTVGSHFMSHFVHGDSPRERSILADPDARARAHQYDPMIDKFREDVRETRGTFTVLGQAAWYLLGDRERGGREPLTSGEPALRAGHVKEQVDVPPMPAHLRDSYREPSTPASPEPSDPNRVVVPPLPQELRDAMTSSQASLSDPRAPEHPDHRLYKQIESGVTRIDASSGRTFDHDSERLTMGALLDAKLAKIASADHIALNVDGKMQEDGSHARAGAALFIVEGRDPGNEIAKRSMTNVEQAVTRPVEQSQQALDNLNRQLAQVPNQQQNQPTQDDPSRGPRIA